jgi:CRP-like cAMP-binding protein
VDRDAFSSTAECVEQTTVRKLQRDDLKKLLENDPVNGLIFFQRLAGMLGDRLLESYSRYEKLYSGVTYV